MAPASLARLEDSFACRGGGEHARAQEAGAYLPDYLSPCAIGGTIRADRSGHGQLCLENSVSGWDYACGVRAGGLPPLDFMARLAALVPRPRTNLTRFHGVLAPNSRYRESVTPLSIRKVKPVTADVEADGLEKPNPRAGKRKGLYGRPPRKEAQASVQYRGECLQCMWLADEDNSQY